MPTNLAGVGFPTYSGRAIDAGTASLGEMRPGIRVPVLASLGILPILSRDCEYAEK